VATRAIGCAFHHGGQIRPIERARVHILVTIAAARRRISKNIRRDPFVIISRRILIANGCGLDLLASQQVAGLAGDRYVGAGQWESSQCMLLDVKRRAAE
jgi:hypothetical protein